MEGRGGSKLRRSSWMMIWYSSSDILESPPFWKYGVCWVFSVSWWCDDMMRWRDGRVLGRVCLFWILSDQIAWGGCGGEKGVKCIQQTLRDIPSWETRKHRKLRYPSPIYSQEVPYKTENWSSGDPNINGNKSTQFKSWTQTACIAEDQNGAWKWGKYPKTRSEKRWRRRRRRRWRQPTR